MKLQIQNLINLPEYKTNRVEDIQGIVDLMLENNVKVNREFTKEVLTSGGDVFIISIYFWNDGTSLYNLFKFVLKKFGGEGGILNAFW